MSCYNERTYVSQSIESILKQSLDNFEFIIINDGSDDGTLDIIKKYSEKDERVRVISKKNTGLVHSLNIGIKYAKGEWVARQDADDVSEPNRLELQYEYAKQEGTVLVGSWCIAIGENGKQLRTHEYPTKHRGIVNNLENAKPCFPHSSAFYNKDIAVKLNGYRSQFTYAQDHDLWARMSKEGRVACLDKYLLRIRKHENTISKNNFSEQMLLNVANVTCMHERKLTGTDILEENPRCWPNRLDSLQSILEREKIFRTEDVLRRIKEVLYERKKIIRHAMHICKSLASIGVVKNITRMIFTSRGLLDNAISKSKSKMEGQ
nr:glycosyltransferase family 2 protein [Salinibacter ruber]